MITLQPLLRGELLEGQEGKKSFLEKVISKLPPKLQKFLKPYILAISMNFMDQKEGSEEDELKAGECKFTFLGEMTDGYMFEVSFKTLDGSYKSFTHTFNKFEHNANSLFLDDDGNYIGPIEKTSLTEDFLMRMRKDKHKQTMEMPKA